MTKERKIKIGGKHMKKILPLFILVSSLSFGMEIFPETYTMQKIIPQLEKGGKYVGKSSYDAMEDIVAIPYNANVQKALGTGDTTIYFIDSDANTVKLGTGDYIIAPKSLSRIYGMSKVEFHKNYRGK